MQNVVITPYIPNRMRSSWAQYTILLESEEERMFAQNKLKDLGIPTMVYYPKPLHKQTVYKDYDFNLGDLKESERISRICLSLPMHPYLDIETVEYISESLKRLLEEYRNV